MPPRRALKGSGQGFNLISQLIEAAWLANVGRDLQATQLFALCNAHTARPEQEQVGLKAEQALHVQLPVAAHRGHAGQLR